MAQELRQITLSNKEAIVAVDAHRRAASGFLPVGDIISLKGQSNGDIRVLIKIPYGKSRNELPIDFSPSDLLPVLMQFCCENNIQISASAKKSVKWDGDSLALVLTNDL